VEVTYKPSISDQVMRMKLTLTKNEVKPGTTVDFFQFSLSIKVGGFVSLRPEAGSAGVVARPAHATATTIFDMVRERRPTGRANR
jgi:hypothetical protein